MGLLGLQKCVNQVPHNTFSVIFIYLNLDLDIYLLLVLCVWITLTNILGLSQLAAAVRDGFIGRK